MVGPRFELAEPKAFVWIVPFALVDWNEWRQDLEFLEPIQIGTFPKTFAFAIAIPRVLLAHFLLALPVPRPWALPLPCKARSPWLPSRSALPPTFALACWACYLGCLWLPLPSWKGLGCLNLSKFLMIILFQGVLLQIGLAPAPNHRLCAASQLQHQLSPSNSFCLACPSFLGSTLPFPRPLP